MPASPAFSALLAAADGALTALVAAGPEGESRRKPGPWWTEHLSAERDLRNALADARAELASSDDTPASDARGDARASCSRQEAGSRPAAGSMHGPYNLPPSRDAALRCDGCPDNPRRFATVARYHCPDCGYEGGIGLHPKELADHHTCVGGQMRGSYGVYVSAAYCASCATSSPTRVLAAGEQLFELARRVVAGDTGVES